MTYQQLFQNAGIPMPAQFAQFSSVEIPAEQLPAYLQQYPPVGAPAPAAPAPAAVPPAAAVPSQAPAVKFDRSNSWPSIFKSIDDIRAEGGQVLDLHSPVVSSRHPGLMVPRCLVRLKIAGTLVQGLAYTSTKRDGAGNVIGYIPIEECSQIQIAQDPTMPGRYSFRLTPGGLSQEVLAKATIAKTKPSFNWAALTIDGEAAD